jgi:hypothetical protein
MGRMIFGGGLFSSGLCMVVLQGTAEGALSMPKTSKLPVETKPAEHISFAQLFNSIPMQRVKETLCETASNDLRERDLPAKYMMYFVMALSLYSDCSSQEVFRNLIESLRMTCGPGIDMKVPAKSSITNSRQRLGAEPFRRLFRNVVKPIAMPGRTAGAFFKQWRLVGVDGVQFNVPDTPENEQAFTRCTTGNGPCSYPSIRVVGLVELGTRVLFDFELGRSADAKETSETKLAHDILPRLKPDQLCIADRLYANQALWTAAAQTGAALLWRVKSDIRLDCESELEDGSYISHLYGERRKSDKYTIVRVIEYQVNDQTFRLITNLLSPSQASATELASLYSERWEYEIANKEQKNALNSYVSVLRSKTPELAEQELIALFLMHYAVRVVMHDAAISIGEDVDRLSFKHTLRVIRRHAPLVGAFPPRSGLSKHTRGST